MIRNIQIRHSGYLMITAMIWGAAFVAQSVAMDYVGPSTFLFARSVIGALALIPVNLILGRINDRKEAGSGISGDISVKASQRSLRNTMLIRGGLVTGFLLFAASITQQIGIQYTTAGKAGFITAFYIIIVPVAGIFFHKKTGFRVWIAVVMGIVGLYYLCITESFTIGRGDILMFLCAFLFTGQILAIDYFNPHVDSLMLAQLEFTVEAILAGVCMFAFEEPVLSDMIRCAVPILYAGLFSTGIAYTLQIIGQQELNPAVASLIMSLEAVFSVIFGFLILGERLTSREFIGCVIMFAAIIIAQLPEKDH